MALADTTWGQAMAFYRQGQLWQAHQWVQLVARTQEGKCEPGGRAPWPSNGHPTRYHINREPLGSNAWWAAQCPCAQGWER